MIAREVLGDLGRARVQVSYLPVVLEFIISCYDDDDDLLHIDLHNDYVTDWFKNLDLNLKINANYVALIRVKPSFVLYEGRHYNVEDNRQVFMIQHSSPIMPSVNFQDDLAYAEGARVQIEIGQAQVGLSSIDLHPFFAADVRYKVGQAKALIERGELQKVVT